MQYTLFLNFRSELDSYRLVHLRKTAEMWNQVFQDHKKASPKCKKDFYPGTWRKNKNLVYAGGRACAATLATLHQRCTIFDEVQKNTPGRRTANIDQGIHVGLSQTSTGS